MKRGIAPQMAEAFGCDEYLLEGPNYLGDMNKLGQIDYVLSLPDYPQLIVVNCYTQYEWSTKTRPFDYEAFQLCMRKINHMFRGKRIGLPQIGSHLAGGDWELIKPLIQKELKDCEVTVVIYKV